MAKVAVALRLVPEKLALVDAYARARGLSRQVVLEAFVDSGLVGVESGMPDLPGPKPTPVKPQVGRGSVVETAEDWALARQARLNASKYRSAS